MSRKRTKACDIQKPERYFAKWLSREKANYYYKRAIIEENEISAEKLCETKEGSAILAINLNEELFTEAEAANAEYGWIEYFQNDWLYDFIVSLEDDEKMILTYKFKYQMSFREMALELNISTRAAEGRYHRIIKKIKKII